MPSLSKEEIEIGHLWSEGGHVTPQLRDPFSGLLLFPLRRTFSQEKQDCLS